MAIIGGPGGAVALPSNFNISASGWSADLILTTADNTNFAGNGYRAKDVVLAEMNGTVVGKAQGDGVTPFSAPMLASTLDPTLAKSTITLPAESGNTYGGTWVVTGGSLSRSVETSMDFTISFESSGVITQTWG